MVWRGGQHHPHRHGGTQTATFIAGISGKPPPAEFRNRQCQWKTRHDSLSARFKEATADDASEAIHALAGHFISRSLILRVSCSLGS
jgi:hypothetical protein